MTVSHGMLVAAAVLNDWKERTLVWVRYVMDCCSSMELMSTAVPFNASWRSAISLQCVLSTATADTVGSATQLATRSPGC